MEKPGEHKLQATRQGQGTSPRRHLQRKICNHDSKAKWLLKVWRGDKTRLSRDQGVTLQDLSAGCAGSRASPRTIPDGLGILLQQHINQGASKTPASGWAPWCVPRNQLSSCGQHRQVLMLHSNHCLRGLLIQLWRSGFAHDPDSLAMPSGFPRPVELVLPIDTQKSSRKGEQWAEVLYLIP